MKSIFKFFVVALLLLSVSLLTVGVFAEEISNESSISEETSVAGTEAPETVTSEPFDDSHVVVEQAAPDYSIIFTVIIGLAIGALIIYVLFKPQKR